MNFLDIYCVTNKNISFLKDKNINYKIGWVGQKDPEPGYICCNNKDNIFYKEKHYSELTFHYWYWKNLLKINEKKWVGFCQRRRFWIKPESEGKKINIKNIQDHLLLNPSNNWDSYESIICEPIKLGTKFMKLIKRGWRNLLKNPTIIFNLNKISIKTHFDMHHGYGVIDRAIDLMDKKDRDEFRNYVNTKSYYNFKISFIKLIN